MCEWESKAFLTSIHIVRGANFDTFIAGESLDEGAFSCSSKAHDKNMYLTSLNIWLLDRRAAQTWPNHDDSGCESVTTDTVVRIDKHTESVGEEKPEREEKRCGRSCRAEDINVKEMRVGKD